MREKGADMVIKQAELEAVCGITSKLPENASEILRIVRIGEYDACACIGQHVENTSERGLFKIISYDYADGKLRLRFKLIK